MLLNEMSGKARAASAKLGSSNTEKRNEALSAMAKALTERAEEIIKANEADIENAKANGMSDAMLDRLTLTDARIAAISESVKKVIALPDPLASSEQWVRPNGIKITKKRVPFGVIAIIYEARPNVTADAAALCVKSGNAVILRGGKEAINSNLAIAGVLSDALFSVGLPKECVQVVPDTSRETANKLMKLKGGIDLLIPRGSKSLIRSVTENATVPVIETGAGNCHVYFDKSADFEKALNIIDNAKRQRPSVCNAAESLLVHEDIANEILPLVKARLDNVEIRGCEKTREIISVNAATDDDFFTEYNDYILAVKVVSGVEEAVKHINIHGTGHSEAIITECKENADYFCASVDAAAVYVNASTRFTDGEEFGFGAEIGISTQKMHARGPMGLPEMTTYKYVINGEGQIR
ncbi:MAG: glutamate-5-semialdehyde dehydrogenase [Clostridia bacterium]|nr:glutamate-5-semialdehyde dehydrogenase [Clostridia bacterium]MBR6784056.1 glutamate-5-semialdehyde dehydrogenase [Clostridia bacterium]